jgi:hypothetical protein
MRRLDFDHLEDRVVPSNAGTTHLTDSTATVVEETHYAAKNLVWLYGNDLELAPGYYDVEVVAPGGKDGTSQDLLLGQSLPTAPVHVDSNGHFDAGPDLVTGPRGTAFNVWDEVFKTQSDNVPGGSYDGDIGSQGYADTPNNGGEYQVVVEQHSDFTWGTLFTSDQLTKSKNFKVEPVTPTGFVINTTYTLTFPGGGGAATGDSENPAAPAPLGSTAQDSATVLDGSGNIVKSGTITFYFYSGDSPNGTLLNPGGDTVPVDPSGTTADPSVEGPLGAGDYYFTATYTPDGSNLYGSDPEPFVILPATTINAITTTLHTAVATKYSLNGTVYSASANDAVPTNSILAYGASGASIYDTVEVDGVPGVPVEGTVTFNFYKGSPPGGTLADTDANQPLVTIDVTVSSSGAASVTEPNLGPGSYYFVATYNGDDQNYPHAKVDVAEPFVVNTPPTAGAVDLGCIAQGTSATTTEATLLAKASDSDGDALSFVGVSNAQPSPGATVTDSSGNITYTPPAGFWGEAGASFSYTVSDGLDSATGTVAVEVDAAVYAGNVSTSTAMNVPVTVHPAVSDVDTTEPLTVSITQPGHGSTVINGSANFTTSPGGTTTLSFTYTPGPDFHGSDSFTYTVRDEDGCISATGTISINVTSNALTQGYWKTHQSAFDAVLAAHPNVTGLSSNGKLLIGSASYTSTEAIAIMNMSAGTGTSANGILILFDQLVAAKLNELNGVVADTADNTAISDADQAIIAACQAATGQPGNTKLSGNKKGQLTWLYNASQAFVQVSSTLGQRMIFDANALTAFNQTGT